MFRRLYEWTVLASAHRRAPWLLGGLSFAESSFFPIPPDVMLAPMVLARPERAWLFALITTLASVFGGIAGYAIGLFFLEALLPWLRDLGYYHGYELAHQWFADYGFWAILMAGFSPIPYKVFTIAAGAVAMPFLPFVLGSIVSRGARFFLVAGLVRWLGPVFEQRFLAYIDRIGWAMVAVVALGIVVMQVR